MKSLKHKTSCKTSCFFQNDAMFLRFFWKNIDVNVFDDVLQNAKHRGNDVNRPPLTLNCVLILLFSSQPLHLSRGDEGSWFAFSLPPCYPPPCSQPFVRYRCPCYHPSHQGEEEGGVCGLGLPWLGHRGRPLPQGGHWHAQLGSIQGESHPQNGPKNNGHKEAIKSSERKSWLFLVFSCRYVEGTRTTVAGCSLSLDFLPHFLEASLERWEKDIQSGIFDNEHRNSIDQSSLVESCHDWCWCSNL